MSDLQQFGGGFFVPEFGKKTGRTAIRSRDANDLVKALNALGRMTVAQGAENTFKYSEANIVLTLKSLPDSPAESGMAGTAPVRAQITALHNDYVDCDIWDGSAFDAGNNVPVAKPVELRHAASDTIYGISASYSYSDTNSRSATAGGFDSENHKVVLPYEVGREILVIDTGLATGVLDGGSVAITYLDLNIGGRTWASVPALPIP